ncbi:MAG: serine/threonine protein kinase [Labilithrix sp.]|nr:serine/threonine protein kinase [Labilithrix sp.]
MLPKRVGHFEILGQLATGGMAEILLARGAGPASAPRAVVIKQILPQYASTASFVAMFLDEARAIARIRHPNVVQVEELGEDEGRLFLVLEYVAGENLASVLKRSVAANEKLGAGLVAWIVAEACAGLHAAHELVTDDGRSQNLVHRDVSPQNLFVAYDGHVKLLDFGVAIMAERVAKTATGDVKGKLEYMSPEHARGERLDRRSDIFAMGVVLYELGTGRRLFKRASPGHTIDAICREPILPPSRLVDGFPRGLEAVCMKALAKRPEDRYATAAEMRAALLDVAREVASPTQALAERMRRWFPDRIAEKEEMLRRVRAGAELAKVPAGEIDERVEVPVVPASAAGPPVRRKARRRRRSHKPLIALLVPLLLSLAIAIFVLTRSP